jgi:4-methylaminobutanoate oxidase (formaldehyde-forming)
LRGEVVGYISSAGYGHTLGGAVGLGYVPCAPDAAVGDIVAQPFEVEVAGRRIPAAASFSPLYDPRGHRIRA